MSASAIVYSEPSRSIVAYLNFTTLSVVRAATVADTLPDRVSPSPGAATLNRNQGRAVPRLGWHG